MSQIALYLQLYPPLPHCFYPGGAPTLAPAALSTRMTPPLVRFNNEKTGAQGGKELIVHPLASCVLGQMENSFQLAKKNQPHQPGLPGSCIPMSLTPRGVTKKSQWGWLVHQASGVFGRTGGPDLATQCVPSQHSQTLNTDQRAQLSL